VHDPPGHEGEQSCDEQCAEEDADHREPVAADIVAPSRHYAEHKRASEKIDSRWIGLQGPTSWI
jgi:hypothetical protein